VILVYQLKSQSKHREFEINFLGKMFNRDKTKFSFNLMTGMTGMLQATRDIFAFLISVVVEPSNGGVSSLQVAAHRKPVLALLRMRDILTRMM
jgi:hypothetical protein